MVEPLPPPLAGLVRLAPAIDVAGVLQRLGHEPARANAQDWLAAGLPLAALHRLQAPAIPGRWTHWGAPDWPRDPLGEGGPVALSFEGDLGLLRAVGVAVVGSRDCTPGGRARASGIAEAIAEAGGCVVSGLARGIDTAAHLSARGRTIAVLACGLQAPMPAWQRRVRERIVDAGGLIVSEAAPFAHATPYAFPVRNRIVAGLSRAVVVVEAARRSGARSTAAHAARLGRDLWAVPGAPDAPASVGCLDLIEDGANIYREPGALLRSVGLARGPAPLAALLAAPCSFDSLVAAAGTSAAWVAEELGRLELTGGVRRLPGGLFQAVSDDHRRDRAAVLRAPGG
jgi:DNA processing protein